jgi:RNA polymerase sigma-70 factor (ECF subfamily)
MDYMNDKELLRLLKADPERGLAQTVRQYGAYVYKIAFTRLGEICSKEDIEEAVSDIFMKLYTSVSEKGTEPRSVCAYLSVIAQRHCTDILRRHKAEGQHISLDEIENIIPDNEVTADSGQIMQALKRLGEPDTEIFVRRYYLGQPVKQIALEMNMKTDTLNKRLSRGLKKLRKMLEEEGL